MSTKLLAKLVSRFYNEKVSVFFNSPQIERILVVLLDYIQSMIDLKDGNKHSLSEVFRSVAQIVSNSWENVRSYRLEILIIVLNFVKLQSQASHSIDGEIVYPCLDIIGNIFAYPITKLDTFCKIIASEKVNANEMDSQKLIYSIFNERFKLINPFFNAERGNGNC